MALDGSVSLLSIPLIAVLLFLLIFAVRARPDEPGANYLTIGKKRLASGYLGALFAVALYSLGNAWMLGSRKVDLGHIPADAFWSWFLSGSLYVYVLVASTNLLLMTLIGVPLFALFSRVGLGSLAGLVLIAVLISAGWAGYAYAWHANLWCEANVALCLRDKFTGFGLPVLMAAMGFGIAARLRAL